ncbi:MAG: DUF5107 domain-containing protein [Bacillota bacterium]|nr:DUF5107 domain-containing protein [Bacillota bacterium]
MKDVKTVIRLEKRMIRSALVKSENPLPNLQEFSAIHTTIEWDDTLSPDDTRYMGYGKIKNILPYTMQDGYTRNRKPEEITFAVLENDILRAEFLPELGGRLWSLYHKRENRELLYVNPVIQPGNLALRNAWFSGGVEWNIGMKGHSPFTCAPLFTQIAKMSDGTPVLRMYEWERKRQCTFQIEAYLPATSEFLYVKVRIVNQQDKEIPMYWWSNISVPETIMTRVLTPAREGFFCRYRAGNYQLTKTPLPYLDNLDLSYATNLTNVMDFFYDVSSCERKWLAALDINGSGLLHLSTQRLSGRKLFVWGMSQGGKHWQEFLSEQGHPYIEIQAGLTPTQLECRPMKPNDTWEWQEAYGYVRCDPEIIHGVDYEKAILAVEHEAESLLPQKRLEANFGRYKNASLPGKTFLLGSGWAALENFRRKKAGESLLNTQLSFSDDSIGAQQQPWLELLECGTFPRPCAVVKPVSYMVQESWRALLEKVVKNVEKDNWYAWYHLGVMRYHAGEDAWAVEAWETSNRLEKNPWALRNLALVSLYGENMEAAAQLYEQTVYLCDEHSLVVECAKALLMAGKGTRWLKIFDSLTKEHKENGRILYYVAMAHIRTGNFFEAEKILYRPLVIDDMREGEISLSNLWYELIEKKLVAAKGRSLTQTEKQEITRKWVLPHHLDFRMNVD